MAINFPNNDLPHGITGASDVWDEGPAGVILSGEFFATPTPPVGGAIVSVADQFSVSLTASTTAGRIGSTSSPASLAVTAATASGRLRSTAAPTTLTVTALDATDVIAVGAVSVQSSADPFLLSITASTASGRVRSAAAPTSLTLTPSQVSSRMRSAATPQAHTLAFSTVSGRIAYLSAPQPTALILSVFGTSSALRSVATPTNLTLTAFDATSEALQAVRVVSDAPPFALMTAFSNARIRMEFDMISQQTLTTEQINDIATAVLAALKGTTIPVDALKMNGADIIGDGSETDPWRGVGVQP